jgi:hypothetical protein
MSKGKNRRSFTRIPRIYANLAAKLQPDMPASPFAQKLRRDKEHADHAEREKGKPQMTPISQMESDRGKARTMNETPDIVTSADQEAVGRSAAPRGLGGPRSGEERLSFTSDGRQADECG